MYSNPLENKRKERLDIEDVKAQIYKMFKREDRALKFCINILNNVT